MIIGRLDVGDQTLVAGRAFTNSEAWAGARVALVSADLGDALGLDGSPDRLLGDSIRLGPLPVRILGVSPASASDGILRVVIPFSLAESVMVDRTDPRPPTLIAVSPTIEGVPALLQAVRAWVAGHDTAFASRVRVVTNETRLAQATQGVLLFKLLMGTVAGVSLAVGGIGIMNVLLAAVAERTREIGIRRAAGARQRDILLQFLIEAVAISGAGSVVGAAAGFAIAAPPTWVMRTRTMAPVQAGWSWSTLGLAAGAAVIVGLAAGLYPALRAAHLVPIDAIRHD